MTTLKLHVEMDDGTASDVTVKPRTQVAFERHFSTPEKPARLDEGLSMEQMYWMAWHAAKIGVEYDQWLDKVEDVTPIVVTDEEQEGPLDSGPPSGTLSPPASNPATASPSTS